MDTEIKNAVNAADQDAQYDDRAKRLLGNKIILAHILSKTVDEFRGMNPKDVVSYIEGEPLINVVPIELGLTNIEKEENGQRIIGMNTEHAEINERLVRFDILLNIVLIGISDELSEHDEKYELHRLLGTLFSMELTNTEKLEIIKNEYGIPLDDKIREDVSDMCNLSQGIREKGRTEREEKIILNMHKEGYTSEQIAKIVEKTIGEVEAIIKKRELVLA